jgi:hypothetical protein
MQDLTLTELETVDAGGIGAWLRDIGRAIGGFLGSLEGNCMQYDGSICTYS